MNSVLLSASTQKGVAMTLVDLFHFYLGDAETIRRLAADPWTLAIGGILVLSAGLARHYDTHDLRRQGWRLLIPFAASTLAASLLFLVIVQQTRGTSPVALGMGILGLFWLTAPFAWLYGLPFERLWRAQKAARARRLALALVAAMRVAVMTQCVAALLDYSLVQSLGVVACFALPTALLAMSAALIFLHQPENRWLSLSAVQGSAKKVVDAMSGALVDFDEDDSESRFEQDPRTVSGPPLDALSIIPEPPLIPLDKLPHRDTAHMMGIGGGCSSLILLVGLLLALKALIPEPTVWPRVLPTEMDVPSPDVWSAVILTVLFWIPWLLWRQSGQRRRTLFVDRLHYGSLAETVRDLANHWPSDFPPNWNPASALAREDLLPRMLDAVCLAAKLPSTSWVRTSFLEKFRLMIPQWADPWYPVFPFRMPEDQLLDLARMHDLLCCLPEGGEMLRPYQDYFLALCTYTKQGDPARSAILEDLLTLSLKRDKTV
jgi:hypothetical protein